MRRPPVILFRLLTTDLIRLLLVTTIALVAVIAFAGALKPLADGSLTLGQAMRFMGLLLVPMTQFALPFAAGFAATLTYHRFASENEAMAASAAGLGHKALLTPALGLGLALSLILGVMSFEVIPPLLRDAQRVLVTDGTRILSSQLNRGESVRIAFGGSDAVDLYADRAFPPEPPAPGSDAAGRGVDRVITLEGVLAVQSRSDADPVYMSAQRVFLFVYDRDNHDTAVELLFENFTGNASDSRSDLGMSSFIVGPFRLPTKMADDPKFLTWSGLREAERRPRMLIDTDNAARVLGARLSEREALHRVRDDFASDGVVTLSVRSAFDYAKGEAFRIEGAALVYDPELPKIDQEGLSPERARRRALRERVDRWRITPRGANTQVRIVRTTPDGRVLTHLANKASLSLPLDKPRSSDAVTHFRLSLEDVTTLDGDVPLNVELTGSEHASAELEYNDLMPMSFNENAYAELPAEDLFDLAQDDALLSDELTFRVQTVAQALEGRIAEQRREIMSKRHERLAFSAGCCIMVLLGASIAMTLRDSLPLPVYLWSFIPALGCIITISAGQRMVHRQGMIGLILLWGGVVALTLLFLRVYSKLRRH